MPILAKIIVIFWFSWGQPERTPPKPTPSKVTPLTEALRDSWDEWDRRYESDPEFRRKVHGEAKGERIPLDHLDTYEKNVWGF